MTQQETFLQPATPIDEYKAATKALYAVEQTLKAAQERYAKAQAALNRSILGLAG